jgi:hypothetical protein
MRCLARAIPRIYHGALATIEGQSERATFSSDRNWSITRFIVSMHTVTPLLPCRW